MRNCILCNSTYNIESHHIIHRSSAKSLIKCKINLIDLCHNCHDFLHHDKNGHALDIQLKSDFEEKLNLLFDREYFTREEIKKTLGISDRAVYSLCKLLESHKGLFSRNDIINRCMGR